MHFEKTGDDDFSFAVPGIARFRVNAYRQRGSWAAVIRTVAFHIPDWRDLDTQRRSDIALKRRDDFVFVIVFLLVVFLLFSCLSARRERKKLCALFLPPTQNEWGLFSSA